MKISGRKSYCDVETDEYTGRFGGEITGSGFGAVLSQFSWVEYHGDDPEGDKIRLMLEAVDTYRDEKCGIRFGAYSVKELLDDFLKIPGLKGSVDDIKDDSFVWSLPNGIVLYVSVERKSEGANTSVTFPEWYIGSFYVKDGKRHELSHEHLGVDDIFGYLVDVQTGYAFWVTRKNMLGKPSLPFIIDKVEFDKIRNKDRYEIV